MHASEQQPVQAVVAAPRQIGAIALALALVATPATAGALERSRPPAPLYQKIVDAAFVRPLGLIPIAVGGTMFLLGYPLVRLAGEASWVTDVCIEEPVAHVFARPLGEL
jgi:hypothetical protein